MKKVNDRTIKEFLEAKSKMRKRKNNNQLRPRKAVKGFAINPKKCKKSDEDKIERSFFNPIDESSDSSSYYYEFEDCPSPSVAGYRSPGKKMREEKEFKTFLQIQEASFSGVLPKRSKFSSASRPPKMRGVSNNTTVISHISHSKKDLPDIIEKMNDHETKTMDKKGGEENYDNSFRGLIRNKLRHVKVKNSLAKLNLKMKSRRRKAR